MSAFVTLNPLLRLALRLDAGASGAVGLLLLGGAPWLTTLLGLPRPLLIGAGAVCLGWALLLGALSRRGRLSASVVWAVIALNVVWVVESLALLLLGWVAPTSLGIAFVIAQALAVALFAQLQFLGLTRARRTAAAV